MSLKLGAKGALIGGVLAAVGASVCCVVPLVLVMLGIGGAWVSGLTAMAPLRPFFLALTLAFFGFGWYRLHRRPRACEPATPCADPKIQRRQRAVFWTAGLLVLALVAFPWVAPLFY